MIQASSGNSSRSTIKASPSSGLLRRISSSGWKPTSLCPSVSRRNASGVRGRDPGTDVVARLKPNVSQQQAETELNLVAARLEQQYPESNKGRRVLLTPLHESFVGNVRQPLLILLGAVGLVLLIACANVANLLLVRSSARQKEMAVRVALGASRATLIRQLLTESVLLAALGAALGILLAFWGTSLIAAQLPDGIPRLQEAEVDAPVLVFTLAVSLLTGLLFGLAPALQASRPNLTEGLKEGERGSSGRRQRLRSVLVVGEVALTLTLLVGAGLLIQSFRRVLQVDPGFKAQNLLTMQVSVNNPDGQQVANFFDQLQQNVRNLPGVKSVAVSNGLPFGRERTSRLSSLKADRARTIKRSGHALHRESRLLPDDGH